MLDPELDDNINRNYLIYARVAIIHRLGQDNLITNAVNLTRLYSYNITELQRT